MREKALEENKCDHCCERNGDHSNISKHVVTKHEGKENSGIGEQEMT